MCMHLRFLIMIICALMATGPSGFTAKAMAQQSESATPASFTIVSEPSGDIRRALTASKDLAVGESRFWLGYRFDLRSGVRLANITIEHGGGITIYHRHSDWYEDDDLETATLRALNKLGDETAKAKLRQHQIDDDSDNWGVFFLVEARTLKAVKIRLLNFARKTAFDGRPVFWLASASTEASFRFLTGMISSDKYQKRVVDAAIFVLSLHEHKDVISYLSGLASGDRYQGIRESAVFWLGNIPAEESVVALVELYRHERERKMKEKLIFSMSRHGSNRSVSVLIDIAKHDTEEVLREKAIFWLGQMAGRKTLAALGGIVKNDENTAIKTRAVFAISQHPDEHQAADMLMEIARSNPNPEVRRKAMFWLAQMGDERAVDFFKEILTKQ